MAPSTPRDTSIDALDRQVFDVLVIGGGINGAVSTAALRSRGADVALIDRGDFAGFTSMHSSNLAWGGIKYLETWEFGLVRKLCRSRNELLRAYPSAVREVRFFTTLTRGFRHHRWFLFLGALLYWAIGGFFTRRPRLLSNADIARDEPAVDVTNAAGGLEYSDAYFVDNDAYFVFRFVRDAMEAGAVAVNYVESLGSSWDGEQWITRVRDRVTQRVVEVRSRALVNACGPMVEEHNERSEIRTDHRHVFSKGVHLIVPRVANDARVLTFFASDGRLFFVIPMGRCSSIGTTDTRVDTLPAVVTTDDRDFILDNINERLKRQPPLSHDDVIAERCGVRPLVVSGEASQGDDDWTALSRKHVLEIDERRSHVCIFGGKLTDCVNVGEEVADAIGEVGIVLQDADRRWYGEAGPTERERFFARATAMGLHEVGERPVSEPPAERLWRRYGPRAEAMLDAIEVDPSQGEVLIPGSDLLRTEAVHSARHERVVHLEDFLRRRTMVEQIVSPQALRQMPQLEELATILFGDRAAAELAAYRGEPTAAIESIAVERARNDRAC
ncbi:MAG: glycerol-3-phosphate dehydrogenase/oxidase [Myxococcota bacterium]